MAADQLPAEIRGYLAELQAQVALLSDRAAGMAGQLVRAQETIEIQKGRIAALESERTPGGAQPED